MNLITSAWNYRPSPEVRGSIKARAVKGIVWFLSMMLCFTLISRATSSMTVPIVDTEKPSRSTIIHTVTVDGVLETVQDNGVATAAGALVKEVHVKEGDTVAAGDLLFTYDTRDFDRQISEYQTQLAQINARLRVLQQQRQQDQEDRELALERAQEDLDTTGVTADMDIQIAEEQIRLAGERVRAARYALDKYDGIRRSDLDDYDDGEYTKEEYDSLRSEYRQAQIAYDEALINRDKAVADKEKTLLDARRAIEDADRPQSADASEDLEKLDAQMINLKLSVLYEAVANKGEVYAPIDGVVTDMRIGAGTRTTNEAALFINNAETMNFVTEVSRDQKKYVNAENSVKLRMAGETKDIRGLAVTSVAPSGTTPNAYRVTVEMPADYLSGTSGTVEIQQKSKSYETVVPLSALHVDGTQYYVFTVRENETSMGTECFAERVNVTLQEKNETYAAVTGALNAEAKIISGTSKSIQDGDRIRLREKA